MGTHPIFESDFDCLTEIMTENEEEVTPEQTDLIVQYSQITGHEDLDKCKDHLKAHNWDISAAINTNMATDNEPPVARVSSHSLPHSVAESSSAGSLGSLFGPETPQNETEVRRRNINNSPPSGIQGQAIPLAPPPPEPPVAASTAIATPSTFSRLLTTILSFSTPLLNRQLNLLLIHIY